MALFGLFGKKRSQSQPLPDDDLEVVKLWQKATAEEDWRMVYRCAERLTANGYAFHWSLGECYLHGRGVAKDTQQALYHFEKAVNEGSATDKRRFADLLTEGVLGKPNPTKALSLYHQAASYDEPYSCLYLYRLQTAGQLEGDQYSDDELAWMLFVATIDNEPGAAELFRQHAAEHEFQAKNYYFTARTTDDPRRELQYTKFAASYGHANALVHLGHLYDQRNDPRAAARYWQAAAELYGDTDSMFNLALLYKENLAFLDNWEENMLYWYKRAAEAGHGSAANNLGVYYQKQEERVQFNRTYKQTLYWFHRAADLGNAKAMYNLYNIYTEGHIVTRDTVKADEYLHKAAALGQKDAVRILRELEKFPS